MTIQDALATLLDGADLDAETMSATMRQIMTGEATPAQIGAFLVALRMKGETVEEVAAAAGVMRSLAEPVSVASGEVVDIVGTGGDASRTFNISTCCCFVAAGAGVRVAKHGNRAVSSRSGAADVLEAAGVNLELSSAEVAACVDEVGVGFMFAPRHHGAMKHAIGPRRELGVRTVFNLLGPLTNPAGVDRQLLGVFSPAWVRPIADVLQTLGSRRAMVVHGADGLDELSISGPSRVAELADGEVREYELVPDDVGLARHDLDALRVDGPEESLARVRSVLDKASGAARDVVLLNAGAAIVVAGLADDLADGVERAADSIDSGRARDALDRLVSFTNHSKHG